MEATAFLEAHPDPVVCYRRDEDSVAVVGINDAFRDTFGVEGSAVSLESTLESAEAVGAVADAIARNEPFDEVLTCETREGVSQFRVRNVPAKDRQGHVVYTDLVQGADEERLAELRERNEQLEAFASVVSHDLRNPIEVAETYLAAARDTGDPEQFDRVADALTDMRRLIEDVLQLAREGRVIEGAERCTLATVAREAWSNADTGDATLELDDETATLKTDPDRLGQALGNLFRNACEHGPRDVSVRVGTLPHGDGTGFYVEDDGPGIPPEERADVFEPGQTTNADGTGLGLAIVERVVDAHGWDVDVEASDAGGARFVVTGVESLEPF